VFEQASFARQEKRPVIQEDKRPLKEREFRREIYKIGQRNAKRKKCMMYYDEKKR
jgi:hypothetical protein